MVSFQQNIKASEIIKHYDSLAQLRSPWEALWQELADYVLPQGGNFLNRQSPVMGRQKIFDSTAPLALGQFAAALESVLTPRAVRWHSLSSAGQEDDRELNTALEELCDHLFNLRYRPEAGFANQLHETYLSLGLFGTAVLYVGDLNGTGPIYRARPLSEFFLGEDQYGRIDTVFRHYQLTARQALNEFEPQNLSENILRAAQNPGQAEKKFDFLHAVFPNPDYNPSQLGLSGWAFSSYHLEKASQSIVRLGGFRTMPYIVSRYLTTSGEIYGRSPAMTVLADIKQVNEMEKTILRAGQKIVDPPLLLPDDDVLSAISLRAGALNYGGLSEDGRPRVLPLEGTGRLNVGLEILNEKRQVINEAFLVKLFHVLLEGPQMTATEVLQRAQEKSELLGPAIGRQQTELLAPIIYRELDIILSYECPPQTLDLILAKDGWLNIQYDSSVARSQRAEVANQVLRTVDSLALLARHDPKALSLINFPEAAKTIAKALGLPNKLLLSSEEQNMALAANLLAQTLTTPSPKEQENVQADEATGL